MQFADWYMQTGRGPGVGGPGTYRFHVTCVPGPSMLPYNVPNDRTLGPSAGRVQNKQQVARADQ